MRKKIRRIALALIALWLVAAFVKGQTTNLETEKAHRDCLMSTSCMESFNP